MIQSISVSTAGEVLGLHRGQRPLPQVEHPRGDRVVAALLDELDGLVVVVGLRVQRRDVAATGQPDRLATGGVVRDLPDRPDRVLEGEIAQRHSGLDHLQHQRRAADLEQRGRLAHVRVADDDVQPPVPFGVGVRFVPGVDDRPGPGGGAGDALPDVVGPLGQAVGRTARRLQHLAGAGDQLPGDQERDQPVGDLGELAAPGDQEVLVAAVGVAGRVGVVLEQVDVAADALLGEPGLGVDDQVLQDPLARLVVRDQRGQVVAFGGGVLGVRSDIEVQPGPVAQEDVRRATPGHHATEQVPGHLVRAQPSLPVKRAGDTELGFDPHDPPLHGPESSRLRAALRSGPRRRPHAGRPDRATGGWRPGSPRSAPR